MSENVLCNIYQKYLAHITVQRMWIECPPCFRSGQRLASMSYYSYLIRTTDWNSKSYCKELKSTWKIKQKRDSRAGMHKVMFDINRKHVISSYTAGPEYLISSSSFFFFFPRSTHLCRSA